MRKQAKKEVPATEEAVPESSEDPIQCNAPAPLVVNGAAYVGCQLIKDHEENHEIKVTWSSN